MTFTIFQDPTFYKNGVIIPSGSVLYSGADLQILQNSIPSVVFPCNGNLNQVLNLFDQAINNLLVQNNLTQLVPGPLGFNPATITINGLHQIEVTAINALNGEMSTLQTLFADLTATNLPIDINLQCLAPAASPCISGIDTYPLIAVLNVMVSEICALKIAVGI